MKTLHLLVHGKVQGVFYRATAKQVADGLGIKGWVRNTPDGKVEIMCQGAEDQLEDFVAWCRRGTLASEVEHVDTEALALPDFAAFEVVR